MKNYHDQIVWQKAMRLIPEKYRYAKSLRLCEALRLRVGI